MAKAVAARVRERKDRESIGDMVGVRNEPVTPAGCDFEEPVFDSICSQQLFRNAWLWCLPYKRNALGTRRLSGNAKTVLYTIYFCNYATRCHNLNELSRKVGRDCTDW